MKLSRARRTALVGAIVLAFCTGDVARAARPPSVGRDVLEKEQRVRDALARPDDLAALTNAVSIADEVLTTRRMEQGENWWETVDARVRVDELHHLVELPQERRAALAGAMRSAESVPRLYADGHVDEAIAALAGIASTFRAAFGEAHPDYGNVLRALGALYMAQGRAEQAQALLLESRAIFETALGKEHPRYATTLNDLALTYHALGRDDLAEPLLTNAVAIRREALGDDHESVADSLDNLALVLASTGRYATAVERNTEACGLHSRLRQASRYAQCEIALGSALRSMGRDAEASAAYEEAMRSIDERDPIYPMLLVNRAILLASSGDYDESERLSRRAAAIVEARPTGHESLEYASVLEALGAAARGRARFSDAQTFFREAVAVRARLQGFDHPEYAQSLVRLAGLSSAMGQYADAERQYSEALSIFEQRHLTTHPSYAVALNDLGLLHQQQGDYPSAVAMFERARAAVDTTAPLYATVLHNLAYSDYLQGREHYADADRLFGEAERALGDRGGERKPFRATLLDNEARLYAATGRYDAAERAFTDALTIRTELFGDDHPASANTVAGLAGVLAATGQQDRAMALLLASAHADWVHLTRNFPALSPDQKARLLAQNDFTQGEQLWALVFRQHQDAKRGLQAVLLRKQLLFEAARQESGALRAAIAGASPEWQARWRQRDALVRRYATAALEGGSESAVPTRELAQQIDALDQQLRRDNPAYAGQAQLQAVDVDQVAHALRPDEALVEYVAYRDYDFARAQWGSGRFGAFVLRNSGDVAAFDLGEAEVVDEAVSNFRKPISRLIRDVDNGENPDFADSERRAAVASSALRGAVWDPLQTALDRVRRAYVAPDGMLGLVPFEALARETPPDGWRYLAEDMELVYLTTARDLARLAATGDRQRDDKQAVVVGSPAFNEPTSQIAEVVNRLQPDRLTAVATDLSSASSRTTGDARDAGPAAAVTTPECREVEREWSPVPLGFIKAAQDRLSNSGWTVAAFTGDEAIEELVTGVHAPGILQFFTHGAYRQCERDPAARWENPLMRSVLLLAGVNTWRKDTAGFYRVGDRLVPQRDTPAPRPDSSPPARVEIADGILTAYEVSGMNLQGTQLVNLTACETGLSDVVPDGVAGLRQAFLMAGARAITMSMWEVPAEETGNEMADFYDRWLAPASTTAAVTRYQAFRQAQLAALARARKDHGSGHPFLWAGTVFVGDPGDLPPSP